MVLPSCASSLPNRPRLLALMVDNAEPEPSKDWSLTSLKYKLIMIGAKVVSRGRYVGFQMAQVAVPRQMFADILSLVARLRVLPAPA